MSQNKEMPLYVLSTAKMKGIIIIFTEKKGKVDPVDTIQV